MATIAFAVYSRTLLPGVDLGDTGGFQAAVLWPETSARQGYPLYYALARPFVRLASPGNPARGLNLFSALCAALAAGLLAYLSARVTRSTTAGAAAGLLLAFSYTFWTQAVIAEVYALHLLLVGVCALALAAWAARPSAGRLCTFFLVYAVSFGNHLMMLLLLVPFAVFLVLAHPAPRQLFTRRIVALAFVAVGAGMLLYLPNFLWVWTNVDTPPAWGDRVAAFWFDTTKADWREAMVLGVSSVEWPQRIVMWMWDARQQFGVPALAVAAVGLAALWRTSRTWAALVATGYAVSVLFAVTYNVGDPHVFFLPAHWFTAFATAAGIAAAIHAAPRSGRRAAAHLVTIAALLYVGWRGWDTWPRADRHEDRRADLLVARLTTGIDDTNAVLLSQMEWQSENALLYAGRFERPAVAWTRLADVLPHLPYFVRDNHAIGRDVVLTSGAAAQVLAAYGPLFAIRQDPVPPAVPFSQAVTRIPEGAPYLLVLLTPMREIPLDEDDFDQALAALTGNRGARGNSPYQLWAGYAGQNPVAHVTADRPFTQQIALDSANLTVTMDGWVPAESFRRGGFGHVVRRRDSVLTIERGASLVWLDGDSSARTLYSGGLYAPAARFRIPADSARQLAGTAGAILQRATPPPG